MAQIERRKEQTMVKNRKRRRNKIEIDRYIDKPIVVNIIFSLSSLLSFAFFLHASQSNADLRRASN